MKEDDIINEVIFNKKIINSPLLLSWIKESDENLKLFISYKNTYALLQEGVEMDDYEILNDLKSLKKRGIHQEKKYYVQHILKYVAVLISLIFIGYSYYLIDKSLDPSVIFNETFISNKDHTLLELPDGSEALLMKDSKLFYPSKFADRTRAIKVEGEVFLNVFCDSSRTFKVYLGDHQIDVLGTEFLVTAYSQEDLVTVDLVSGKIKMNIASHRGFKNYVPYELEPNQSLVLNKSTGSVRRFETKDEDKFYISYLKNGFYKFKAETFECLALKLERIYNITILFEDDTISLGEYTGAIYANSTISETLDIFKKVSKIQFDYIIENNKVYIKHLN